MMNTAEWFSRASQVIPNCSQTFSKAPNQYLHGAPPACAASASGAWLTDLEGHRYLDYPMALGAVILGYNHPSVTAAVVKQLQSGASFTLPHFLELELAEKLCSIIPCCEMVRLLKNGSDATTAAIRLARAVTGRDRVIMCGYHGWHDWSIAQKKNLNIGVPFGAKREVFEMSWNDIQYLESAFSVYPHEIAAVILDTGAHPPAPGFLEKVRLLTQLDGALLIFDEVVSGFRVHLGGAQALFGVTPDLACFGKAMANGFPISALVGLRDIMQALDRVFVSTTFGGDTISIAAALATIAELEKPETLKHIRSYGLAFRRDIGALIEKYGLSDYISFDAHPQNTIMVFREQNPDVMILKSLFQQLLLSANILFNGVHAFSLSHGEDEYDLTLAVYEGALAYFSEAIRSGTPEQFLTRAPITKLFLRR